MNLTGVDLWPRDTEHRFRLYGRSGASLYVLAAAPTIEGIGTAIATLDADAREAGGSLGDEGQIGVLDVLAGQPRGRWLIKPWSRP